MTMKRLSESVLQDTKTVLETPGKVKDVKVLGYDSLNGRRYEGRAMTEALGLYEDKFVYIDHPRDDFPRRFADKFGRLKNPRYVEGDGVRADLTYNPDHPLAKVFEGWLKTDPRAVGFSHNATGDVREEDGVDVVYKITSVESVDLVADPATTQGIHEAMEPIVPDPNQPAEGSATPQLDQALADLIAAILADAGLDAAAKSSKVLKALKLLGDEEPEEGAKEDEEPDDDEKKPVDESDDEDEPKDDDDAKESCRRLKSKAVARVLRRLDECELRLARIDGEAKARQRAKAKGLPEAVMTPVFVDLLVSARDDAARDRLIEDRQSVLKAGGVTPVSVPPSPGEAAALTVDALVLELSK